MRIDQAERDRRNALSNAEAMADAQSRCAPCKLCGGRAVISDAGVGWGYYITCENAPTCIMGEPRRSGWAYNVMDLWNDFHAPTPPDQSSIARIVSARMAGGEGVVGDIPPVGSASDLARCLKNITDLYVQMVGHETSYSREARAALSTATPPVSAREAPSPQAHVVGSAGLDEATKRKLREALCFSASRSVITAEDERRILAALATASEVEEG